MRFIRSRFLFRVLALPVVFAGFGGARISAQTTLFWQGGPSDTWFGGDTGFAWNDGNTGVPWANGSIAYFAGNGTIPLEAGYVVIVGGIRFGTAGLATSTSIYDSSLTLAAGATFSGNDPGGQSTLSLASTLNGSAGLTFNGPGALVLSGANTYTGLTTINGGALYIQNASGLGTTAAGTSVASGAALHLQNGIAVGAEALTLNGSGLSGNGALRNINGINSYAGAITLSSATTIGSDAGTLTLGPGGISGAFGLTFTGAGGVNVQGVISSTVTSLTKTGTGTLSLSGANAYTGLTTITGGTLNLQNASGLGTTAAGTSVASGATLALQENTAIGAEALTLNGSGVAGNGALRSVSDGNSYAGAITLASATTIGSDSGLLTLGAGGIAGAFDLTFSGSGLTAVQGVIDSTVTSLTKTGAGTLTLSGANVYPGLTTITGGALNVQNPGGLGTTAAGTSVASGAALQLQGGIAVGAEVLTLNGGGVSGTGALRNVSGANSYAGAITLGSAATIGSDAGTLTLGAGGISGAFGLTFTGAGNITAGLIGSSVTTLTKTGNGTLTLPGANTFSGDTTIAGGTMVLSNSSALSSGAVTLASGHATTLLLDSAVPGLSFNNPITVSAGTGAATIGSTAGSNYSIFAGPLSLNRPTTLNDGGISGQRTTFTGVISGDVGTLTVTGNRVSLEAANTFAGNVAIGTGGTLQISSGNQVLPLSATVDTGTGGRLWIVGDTTIGALTGSAGSFVSAVPDTGSFTLYVGANNSDSTFGGSLQNSGYLDQSRLYLAKIGSGALTLTGNNNTHASTVLYAGTLILGADDVVGNNLYLHGGTLQASGNRSLPDFYLQTDATIGGPDNLTITGQVTGDVYATHSLVKSGSGTLTYAASFSGDPQVINVVDDGTLVLAASSGSAIRNSLFVNPGGTVRVDAANQIAYNSNIYLQGGTLHLNNVSDGYTQGFQTGSLYLTGGTLSASGVNGAFHQGGTTTTYASPDTSTISAPFVLDGTNTNLTFTVADGAAATDLAITGPVSSVSGAVNLVKQGAGTLLLSGDNTYTGSTTLTAGTLVAASATALSDSSVFLNGGTLHLTNGAALQNSALTITASTVTFGDTVTAATFKSLASATANAATSGIVLTNTAAVPQGVQLTTGTSTLTSYFGVLSGLGGLTKTGTGTLVLRGVNTYAGPTQVLQGNLNLAGSGRLPSTTDLYINGGFFNTSIAATVGTLSGAFASQVNLSVAGSSLATDGLGTASPYAGGIFGPGAFTKQGTGTLVLSGGSLFDGLTSVTAGVLNLQNATALGSTAAGTTVSSGAALELQGGITIGAEALTLRGAGATAAPNGALRNVSGANSYAGAITLGSATTITSDTGTLTLGAGGITGSATALTIDGAGATVVQGIIATTSGTLTKNGSGLLTLSGANTFTGLTTINAGTLRLSGGSAISNTAAVSLANAAGATLDLNGTSETIGSLAGGGTTGGSVTLGAATLTTGGANTSTAFAGLLSGTGGLTKTGTGTLVLSGASNYSGATAINAGALNLQHATALGTTAGGTSVAAGAALELQGGIAIGAEALALNGTGVTASPNGALRNVSGANSYAGAITLGSATTITSTAGTLTLGAGGITGAAQPLTFDGAGNTSITGVVATGSGTLAKTGTGTLSLSGANANTFTGTTTISGGTVTLAKDNNIAALSGPISILAGGRLDYAGFNQLSVASAALMLDGGTLDIQGAGYRGFAPSLDFRSGTILTTGGGTSTQLNLSADSPGAFTVRGGLTVPLTLALVGTTSTSGLTYDATGNGGLTTMTGAVVLADAGTTFTIQDSTAPIDLSITGAIVEVFGARQLIKTGAGTLELTAANTLSNGTALKAGGLAIGNDAALGSGTFVIEAGTVQATGGARTLANAVTLAGNFTLTGAPALTFAGASTLTGNRTITSASGSSATFSGAIGDGGGVLGLTKLGAGTLTLSGTNSYTGPTIVSAGTLTLAGPQGAGAGTTIKGPLVIDAGGTVRVTTGSQISDTVPITINAGTLLIDNAIEGHTTGGLAFNGGQLTAAGTGQFHLVNGLTTNAAATTALISAPLVLFPGSTFIVAAGAAPGGIDLSITGSVSQTTGGALTKTGAGTLQLSGPGSYTGGTTISFGTVITSHASALGTGPVTVSGSNSILNLAGSSLANAVTAQSGGLVKGTGGVGALTINSGGTLAPGNSPGTMNSGATTWNSGGTYQWEINNATGTVGTNWDLLNITGALSIASTSGGPFTLSLVSLTTGNAAGQVLNFNNTQTTSYTFATASGGIAGFDTSKFTLNTSGFQNDLGGGTWSLSQIGNNLNLNFTPSAIPEPSTYAAIFGIGVLGLAIYRRRRNG